MMPRTIRGMLMVFPATREFAMTIRVLLAAIAAGLLAGLLMTPVHLAKVAPLILQAEQFEAPNHETSHVHVHQDGAQHVHETVAGSESQPAPPYPSLGRSWNTLLAKLVTGAGFGLLLAGVSLLSRVPLTFASGLAWGAAGWLAIQFLPAIGLPPGLPGFPFVDVHARQYWWLATAAASVIGMLALISGKGLPATLVGLVLIVAPHVYGAPQPADISSKVPAFLAAEFVMASLSTSLFFWLVLGLALGFLMERSEKAA
jgi:cobalt transporter subunit CbtA